MSRAAESQARACPELETVTRPGGSESVGAREVPLGHGNTCEALARCRVVRVVVRVGPTVT